MRLSREALGLQGSHEQEDEVEKGRMWGGLKAIWSQQAGDRTRAPEPLMGDKDALLEF